MIRFEDKNLKNGPRKKYFTLGLAKARTITTSSCRRHYNVEYIIYEHLRMAVVSDVTWDDGAYIFAELFPKKKYL